jgi:hypothetical protein
MQPKFEKNLKKFILNLYPGYNGMGMVKKPFHATRPLMGQSYKSEKKPLSKEICIKTSFERISIIFIMFYLAQLFSNDEK